MVQVNFTNDYSECAHHRVIKTLQKLDLTQHAGYGLDLKSNEASLVIKKLINSPESNIFFVSGGTQANLVSISSMLRPYESVISPNRTYCYTRNRSN